MQVRSSSIISRAKREFPQYSNKDDEWLYDFGVARYKLDPATVEPYAETIGEDDSFIKSLANIGTAPGRFAVKTAWVPFPVTGVFPIPIGDSSFDFLKHAWNTSLTGVAAQALTGEKPFDLDANSLSNTESFLSTVASFFMPLDMLTFIAGGGIGGALAKQSLVKLGTKRLLNYAEKGMVRSVMGKKITESEARKVVKRAMTQDGFTTFGARVSSKMLKKKGKRAPLLLKAPDKGYLLKTMSAKEAGALGAFNIATSISEDWQTKGNLDDIDWYKAGKRGLQGLFLGGVTGVIGGKFLQARGVSASESGTKNVLKELFSKDVVDKKVWKGLGISKPVEIGVKALTFGTLGPLSDGDMPSLEQYKHDFMLFTAMSMIHGGVGSLNKRIAKKKQELFKFKLSADDSSTLKDAIERIESHGGIVAEKVKQLKEQLEYSQGASIEADFNILIAAREILNNHLQGGRVRRAKESLENDILPLIDKIKKSSEIAEFDISTIEKEAKKISKLLTPEVIEASERAVSNNLNTRGKPSSQIARNLEKEGKEKIELGKVKEIKKKATAEQKIKEGARKLTRDSLKLSEKEISDKRLDLSAQRNLLNSKIKKTKDKKEIEKLESKREKLKSSIDALQEALKIKQELKRKPSKNDRDIGEKQSKEGNWELAGKFFNRFTKSINENQINKIIRLNRKFVEQKLGSAHKLTLKYQNLSDKSIADKRKLLASLLVDVNKLKQGVLKPDVKSSPKEKLKAGTKYPVKIQPGQGVETKEGKKGIVVRLKRGMGIGAGTAVVDIGGKLRNIPISDLKVLTKKPVREISIKKLGSKFFKVLTEVKDGKVQVLEVDKLGNEIGGKVRNVQLSLLKDTNIKIPKAKFVEDLPKPRKMQLEDRVNALKKTIADKIGVSLSTKKGKEAIEDAYERFAKGLGMPKKIGRATASEIESMNSFIVEYKGNKKKRLVRRNLWLSLKHQVSRLERQKGMGLGDIVAQKVTLKELLGMTSGSGKKKSISTKYATVEQLSKYVLLLRQLPDYKKESRINTLELLMEMSPDSRKWTPAQRALWKAHSISAPWMVLEGLGGKPGKDLSTRMLEYVRRSYRHLGEKWYRVTRAHMALYGIIRGEFFTPPREVLDRLRFIDPEVYHKEKEAKLITEKDTEFFENMYHVDSKGKVHFRTREYERKTTGTIPLPDKTLRGSIKSTKEGEAGNQISKLYDYYWKSFMRTAEIVYAEEPAKLKKFKAKWNKKYVTNYWSRSYSEKAEKFFNENPNSASAQSAMAYEILTKMAEKETQNIKNVKEKQKKWEEIVNDKDKHTEVLALIANKKIFGRDRLPEPGILKDRVNDYFPEKIPGTDIRLFETNFERNIDLYSMRMSKFLATFEMFPQYSGFGEGLLSKTWKANMERIEGGSSDLAKYAQKNLDLMIKGDASSYFNHFTGAYATGVRYSIMGALSAFTAGLKNLFVTFPSVVSTIAPHIWAEGYLGLLARVQRLKVGRTGAFESATKPLSQSKLPTFWFKWVSLMTPTEMANRITSVTGINIGFEESVKILRGEKTSKIFEDLKYNQAVTLMRETLKLSDAEINFIVKHGIYPEGISPNLPHRNELISKIDVIREKVDWYAHAHTQGLTASPYLPEPFSKKALKPLTPLYRMALATTSGLFRNVYKPLEAGNPFPLIKYSVANVYGGAALWAVMDMLGQSPEKAGMKGDNLDLLKSYALRNEIFGVFNNFATPYNEDREGRFIVNTLDKFFPLIWRNIELSVELVSDMAGYAIEGDKWKGRTYGQSLDNYASNVLTAYSLSKKVYYKQNNEYMADLLNVRRKVNSYAKGKGDSSTYRVAESVARTKFYKDLKHSFNLGDIDKAAHYYWTAYYFIVHENEINGGMRSKQASKQARAALLNSLNSLDPVWFSDEGKGRKAGVSKQEEFIRDIADADLKATVKSLKKQYAWRLRKLKSAVRKLQRNNGYDTRGLF